MDATGGNHLMLEARGLKMYFPIKTSFLRRVKGYVKAVDDVTISVRRGETLGLVGESGCGKTTLGRCILRAIEPSEGEVVYNLRDGASVDLLMQERKDLRQVRRNMQMVFQDPYASLDPRMSVLDLIGEPLVIAGQRRAEVVERVGELMGMVGLHSRYMRRYPHAFSGGQRQRIAVARALATNPEFLVCDEPVSALDVSVRSQILNLLLDLQDRLNLSYLFISHDLSVIRHISHRVGVMYVGKMVEMAETGRMFAGPKHPYTEALLSAIPQPDPRLKRDRVILKGDVANPARPPSGCYFHPRCRHAVELCSSKAPELLEMESDHWVACHRVSELALQGE